MSEPADTHTIADVIDVFCSALLACGGSTAFVGATDVAVTVAALIRDGTGADPGGPSIARVLVTPDLEDLASPLRAEGLGVTVAYRDGGTSVLEEALRQADAAVTKGLMGVARSGTVVVGPGGGNGGLLAALPPHHIVLLAQEDLRLTLGEAIAEVAQRFSDLEGEAVFITGPSRTADIEMMSVLGVHGPLRLDVVVVRGGR